ncbi:MAG: hypothetical protein R6X07_13535, partial [Desulfatiglandales bacterium]
EIPPMPKYTLFQNLDLRLDPTCAGWLTGELTDVSQNMGYFRFRDGRPVDLLSLFLIIDAMPPAKDGRIQHRLFGVPAPGFR